MSVASSAAEFIAVAKTRKYTIRVISDDQHFRPNSIRDIRPNLFRGGRIRRKFETSVSDDLRETSFLFQRLSVTVLRGNAVYVLATRHAYIGN